MNINGWEIIARWLVRKGKTQSDLARLLGISPAAITQIKKGQFRLSIENIERICQYLRISQGDKEQLYLQIVNVRFGLSNIKFCIQK